MSRPTRHSSTAGATGERGAVARAVPSRALGRAVARSACAAAAVLLLAACSGGAETGERDSAAPPTTAPSSAAADPQVAGATSSPAPSAGPTRTVTSMTAFSSPTGNIVCYLAPVQGAGPYARCDQAGARWTRPLPEGGCDGTWGGSGGLGVVGVGDGEAQPLCVAPGDTVAGTAGDSSAPPPPVLEWGDAITLGSITCTSRDTGMTCENEVTGHGFTTRVATLAIS